MNEEMKEYLGMYIKEAEELLGELNASLLEFEKDTENPEHLRSIARCAHTLKSSSASMGFQKISDLAHLMEDTFGRLERKEVSAPEGIIDTLFECFDLLETGIASVGNGDAEPDTSGMVKKLDEIMSRKSDGPGNTESAAAPGPETGSQSIADKPQNVKLISSIKVDVKVLENLLNLVGELLIAKMKLQSINQSYRIKDFDQVIDVLGILTEEIQYEVTEARMIPIGQVFNRFPRMIRDISKKEGKEIDFVVTGGEIRLDRTVLDQLGEPLIHLLRNSVDHGIESPEDREKNGKTKMGRIELKARREKNYVLIDIIDDGMGFDVDTIKEIAIKKGVSTKEELAKMSEKEIMALTFLPGFTTSKKVTDVSGRGVGLDVVKKKMEELNGTIAMESLKGKGTTFTIKLPPTMAIVKCLLVTLAEMTYAIPIANILRIVRVNTADMKHIERNEVFLLDGEDVPLIRLRQKFHHDLPDKKTLIVLIIEQNKEKVGLAVDTILGEQEIMIKSLMNELKTTKGYAGATILGSGKPALVLDVATIISSKM